MMQLANTMPSHFKFGHGQTKYLVRQYLAQGAPPEVSKRPKRGFTVPIASWLTQELKPWAEQLLDPVLLKKEGMFNPVSVQKLWREHQNQQANHAKALWTLLVFQHWYHTNLKQWQTY